MSKDLAVSLVKNKLKTKNKKAIADGLLNFKKVADQLILKLNKLVSQFS